VGSWSEAVGRALILRLGRLGSEARSKGWTQRRWGSALGIKNSRSSKELYGDGRINLRLRYVNGDSVPCPLAHRRLRGLSEIT
jgi:hypothetical protein